MRAITVWQPWASLIAQGVKTIETRGRAHPWRSAIGQTIGIHAAKCRGGWGAEVGNQTLMREMYDTVPRVSEQLGLEFDEWPRGVVLGTCTLIDVVPILAGTDALAAEEPRPCVVDWADTLTYYGALNLGEGDVVDAQRPFGDYTPGRWALILDDVVKLEKPILARGKQGLWRWDENR